MDVEAANFYETNTYRCLRFYVFTTDQIYWLDCSWEHICNVIYMLWLGLFR